jgi:multidrug efflux pump
MEIMKEYASKLPAGIASEWTSVSFEQEQSSGQAGKLYAVSIVAVLLCLAALYESAGVPIAVILAVPLGVLGAVLASPAWSQQRHLLPVGLLTTVGHQERDPDRRIRPRRHDHGRELVDAAIVAAKERLRPILMTSFAFVLGRPRWPWPARGRLHIAIGRSGWHGGRHHPWCSWSRPSSWW